MATTEYATLAQVKAWLGITGTSQDTILPAVITAASRAIDDFCGRRFWVDDSASERFFTPDDPTLLFVPDIASTTGLVVATDSGFDGTYEQVWTSDARTGYGYRLEPVNALAAAEAVEKRPYTRLRALSGEWPSLDYSVSVTATWGWPSVPAEISNAALLLTSRLWKRKDAVLGVAGGPDVGFLELARRMDPDIARSLYPFRREAAIGV